MSTSTPTTGTTTAAQALRAILAELTPAPGTRPFSSDSYLPPHLIEQAKQALINDIALLELQQTAFNALSMAQWHIAHGEGGQALSRLRRAQTHITRTMGGGAV
ncbi:MAG: hypothetical protein K9K38_06630 [Rhodoferax sp.]|nr:hypothetical protein [Rhodoferax sp.]